jgi:predicted nucleic acid-binding protein
MLAAPHLIDPEFLSVMRKLTLRRPEQTKAIERVLLEFRHLPIARFEHEPLGWDAWAWRDELTAHDAMYVALARELRVPLVTADEKLARAAGKWCDVRRLRELQPA